MAREMWRVVKSMMTDHLLMKSFLFTDVTAMKRCTVVVTRTLVVVCTCSSSITRTPCGDPRLSTIGSTTRGREALQWHELVAASLGWMGCWPGQCCCLMQGLLADQLHHAVQSSELVCCTVIYRLLDCSNAMLHCTKLFVGRSLCCVVQRFAWSWWSCADQNFAMISGCAVCAEELCCPWIYAGLSSCFALQ